MRTRPELDDQWVFSGKNQKRVQPTDSPELSDRALFIALGATSKAVSWFKVGDPNAITTDALVSDLGARIVNRPQITADGFGRAALAAQSRGHGP